MEPYINQVYLQKELSLAIIPKLKDSIMFWFQMKKYKFQKNS